MNMLFFLLLLTAGEAAFFEFTVQQQSSDGFQQQQADWQTKADSLESDNKQLLATKTGLAHDVAAAQIQVTFLSDELKKAQKEMTQVKAAVAVATSKIGAAVPAPTPERATLGNISTVSGKTFQNCQLLKVEADGITFSHDQGITKVLYPDLPLDVQKRFGVDPESRSAKAAADLRYQEQLQQASATNQPPAQ